MADVAPFRSDPLRHRCGWPTALPDDVADLGRSRSTACAISQRRRPDRSNHSEDEAGRLFQPWPRRASRPGRRAGRLGRRSGLRRAGRDRTPTRGSRRQGRATQQEPRCRTSGRRGLEGAGCASALRKGRARAYLPPTTARRPWWSPIVSRISLLVTPGSGGFPARALPSTFRRSPAPDRRRAPLLRDRARLRRGAGNAGERPDDGRARLDLDPGLEIFSDPPTFPRPRGGAAAGRGGLCNPRPPRSRTPRAASLHRGPSRSGIAVARPSRLSVSKASSMSSSSMGSSATRGSATRRISTRQRPGRRGEFDGALLARRASRMSSSARRRGEVNAGDDVLLRKLTSGVFIGMHRHHGGSLLGASRTSTASWRHSRPGPSGSRRSWHGEGR